MFFGQRRSCRPNASVSHIMTLTVHAISRRSRLQLVRQLEVKKAPAMTRTSELRFWKTAPIRVGASLSARVAVNRKVPRCRSFCHGLLLFAAIDPIYLTSFISHRWQVVGKPCSDEAAWALSRPIRSTCKDTKNVTIY